MHLLLYALTAVVLVSGLLRMPAPFSVFHLVTVPNLLSDPDLLGDIDTIHTLSCRVLAVCVVLHISAVIKHHSRGVNMLSRMT
jgi:cytochrome b561